MSSTTAKVLNQSSFAKLIESGSDTEVHDGWRFILNKHYMSHSSSLVESVVPIPDELESVQTLKFLGITQFMAPSITWERY